MLNEIVADAWRIRSGQDTREIDLAASDLARMNPDGYLGQGAAETQPRAMKPTTRSSRLGVESTAAFPFRVAGGQA